MKKPIITIERQYGSGGSVIGQLAANKLGINCYNRQILKMTAERCGLDISNLESAEENVPTSFLYSLLLSANPARTMEENLPLSDKVFIMESRIINEIAEKEQSFVLVGRCGNYILEDKGCFSVYIYADPEERMKRAVKDYDIEENKAESVMKKADKRRETFYNVNTGKRWQDKDQYSLCLNSAELGDELCAELIVKAYQEYNSRFAE
ncbi:MAG: cytidylate kinase-like family protein [Ruminococcus sp.]|uniref:cytidylate kinase-like family protein n=1 Tax=Ruminococcus flavefaciens TaxID=1265 RepID=UPI0026F34443|nr:cytidylate kinase-like family protein [Ruminococcus flavefaciens]MBR0511578.1 cytidylate kinase-like family protein [Ruminococcus sp.]